MSDEKFGEQDYQILNQQQSYQGFMAIKTFKIRHRLFAGGSVEIQRECLERGDAMAVLLYDPVRQRIVLVEQFRVGAIRESSPWLLELVAGMIEPGETAEAVAYREADEEAGAKLLALWPICEYYTSPGGSSEKVHLYLARVDSQGMAGIFGIDHEHEDIRLHNLGFLEVMDLLASGQLNNAATIIALQWLKLNKQQVDDKWS